MKRSSLFLNFSLMALGLAFSALPFTCPYVLGGTHYFPENFGFFCTVMEGNVDVVYLVFLAQAVSVLAMGVHLVGPLLMRNGKLLTGVKTSSAFLSLVVGTLMLGIAHELPLGLLVIAGAAYQLLTVVPLLYARRMEKEANSGSWPIILFSVLAVLLFLVLAALNFRWLIDGLYFNNLR